MAEPHPPQPPELVLRLSFPKLPCEDLDRRRRWVSLTGKNSPPHQYYEIFMRYSKVQRNRFVPFVTVPSLDTYDFFIDVKLLQQSTMLISQHVRGTTFRNEFHSSKYTNYHLMSYMHHDGVFKIAAHFDRPFRVSKYGADLFQEVLVSVMLHQTETNRVACITEARPDELDRTKRAVIGITFGDAEYKFEEEFSLLAAFLEEYIDEVVFYRFEFHLKGVDTEDEFIRRLACIQYV
ncbi:hypothetical protein LXL04_027964 [Taraxacum kok-saghyz]